LDSKNSLEKIIARFDRYHPARIDLTLERIIRLLDELNSPHKDLPRVIHVAGTNGKGSTISFLRSIYEAAGLVVSTYTSPHLIGFNERYVLEGDIISESDLCAILKEVEAINNGEPITQFEILTAAAFLSLSRTNSDVVLIETGLGGRFDATNVVDNPIATIITPVSMDHEMFLGSNINSIAGEKAAIQKSGAKSIIAPQSEEVMKVIERQGIEVGAKIYQAGVDYEFEKIKNGFSYTSKMLSISIPRMSLVGPHQIINAATAVACVEQCEQIQIDEKHIINGISNASWSGRLELLSDGILKRCLPQGWDVWLDAGHNEAAGKALCDSLSEIRLGHKKPLHIFFGMLEDKNPAVFLKSLVKHAASLTAVPLVDEPRGHIPEDLLALLRDEGIEAISETSIEEALNNLAKKSHLATILICGSHSLVGRIIRLNTPISPW
jgi:dihydrofolate synthase/folylpolyglutamate synthase